SAASRDRFLRLAVTSASMLSFQDRDELRQQICVEALADANAAPIAQHHLERRRLPHRHRRGAYPNRNEPRLLSLCLALLPGTAPGLARPACQRPFVKVVRRSVRRGGQTALAPSANLPRPLLPRSTRALRMSRLHGGKNVSRLWLRPRG